MSEEGYRAITEAVESIRACARTIERREGAELERIVVRLAAAVDASDDDSVRAWLDVVCAFARRLPWEERTQVEEDAACIERHVKYARGGEAGWTISTLHVHHAVAYLNKLREEAALSDGMSDPGVRVYARHLVDMMDGLAPLDDTLEALSKLCQPGVVIVVDE